MTGGTARAQEINQRLAEAAQARGLALGVGSQRTALEAPETAVTFQVRHVCLFSTSDAAGERSRAHLGGRRII